MARRLLVAALAVALTLITFMTTAAAEAQSWHHVPVPAQVRPQAGLNEAVALGPDRAWVVGADAVGREAPGFPLVLRWDGTAWQRQNLPGIGWQESCCPSPRPHRPPSGRSAATRRAARACCATTAPPGARAGRRAVSC